jgi:hypothetical protein
MLEVCLPIWVWQVSGIDCLLCVWAYYAFLSCSGVFAGIGVRIVYMIEVCLPIWVWHAFVLDCFVWRGSVTVIGAMFRFTLVIAFFDFLFVAFGCLPYVSGFFINEKQVTPFTLLFFSLFFHSNNRKKRIFGVPSH